LLERERRRRRFCKRKGMMVLLRLSATSLYILLWIMEPPMNGVGVDRSRKGNKFGMVWYCTILTIPEVLMCDV
jgi:hypothetical protein